MRLLGGALCALLAMPGAMGPSVRTGAALAEAGNRVFVVVAAEVADGGRARKEADQAPAPKATGGRRLNPPAGRGRHGAPGGRRPGGGAP